MRPNLGLLKRWLLIFGGSGSCLFFGSTTAMEWRDVMPELLDYADAHSAEILGTLSRLVGQESFTTDKAGTDTLSAYIRGRLESMGAVVQSVPQSTVGDHLIADYCQSRWLLR